MARPIPPTRPRGSVHACTKTATRTHTQPRSALAPRDRSCALPEMLRSTPAPACYPHARPRYPALTTPRPHVSARALRAPAECTRLARTPHGNPARRRLSGTAIYWYPPPDTSAAHGLAAQPMEAAASHAPRPLRAPRARRPPLPDAPAARGLTTQPLEARPSHASRPLQAPRAHRPLPVCSCTPTPTQPSLQTTRWHLRDDDARSCHVHRKARPFPCKSRGDPVLAAPGGPNQPRRPSLATVGARAGSRSLLTRAIPSRSSTSISTVWFWPF